MVAKTVFLRVGVVCVTGSIEIANVFVIVGMLIGITNFKTYGSACSPAFEDARKQLYMIGFIATCGDGRLSRTTSRHFCLKELFIDLDTRRHAVDDAPHSHTMAFAEGRQLENVTETIHFA